MSSIGSLTLCIQHLQSPDGRERDEAARVIWERFAARLQALVRRHLDNRIRRREDEQDILQSMYASFCHGQLEGKASPKSRHELWKLLVRITLKMERTIAPVTSSISVLVSGRAPLRMSTRLSLFDISFLLFQFGLLPVPPMHNGSKAFGWQVLAELRVHV